MAETPPTRTVYDVNATRIEVHHREVRDPDVASRTMLVAALWSHNPGCEPTCVELDEDEARALAAALVAGFAEDERARKQIYATIIIRDTGDPSEPPP